MAMKPGTTKRYSFYVNLEYAEKIEQLAKENGVSVNGMLNVLIRQAIDSKKNLDTMTNFMAKVVELVDSGKFDELEGN